MLSSLSTLRAMADQPSKLRCLVGALKDTAAIGRATLLSPPPDLVVLRATSHGPAPSRPKHITALLSLGHCSRLTASAAARALASRLLSTHDAFVTLKCLLAAHHVVRHGAFILHDQLLSALLPSPRGGRNPLNLSGFRPSAYARWYARFLELVLASHRTLGSFPQSAVDGEKLVTLANWELLLQLESLVAISEEAGREPEAAGEERRLVREVWRLVEEERGAVVEEVVARVREVAERVPEMEFGDLVEVGFMARRVEGCGPLNGNWRVRMAVEEAKAKMEGRLAAVAGDGGRELRRAEKVGQSERVPSSLRVDVRFGSSRWSSYRPD